MEGVERWGIRNAAYAGARQYTRKTDCVTASPAIGIHTMEVYMKIEELDLDVRQFNVLKRAGIDTTEDFINYPDKERLKRLTGRTYGVMEELLRTGTISDENISAPAQTETAVVFDYSELDTDTAAKLETLTAEIFNVRKEYIFTMAKKVAYAHDLLANYGNGKFGAWCESIGITRQTGNNLIQIVKLFDNSTEIERQNLEKLTDGNVKLLYEAARPSAPDELVEAVKNGDITTHKEYIELKKELERTKETAKNQSLTIGDLLKQQSELVQQNSSINLKLSNANKKIEELESRPVEVAVDVDELNRRVEKVSIELQNQTARQIAAEREDFAQKLNRMEDENDELRAELEKAKAAKTNDNVKTVLMRMTLDELAELAEVVPNGKFKTIIKKAQVLRV